MHAYMDYGDFHPNCDVELVASGGIFVVHCKDCGVVAELESISTKTDHDSIRKVGKRGTLDRNKVGQRSPGHPKGI